MDRDERRSGLGGVRGVMEIRNRWPGPTGVSIGGVDHDHHYEMPAAGSLLSQSADKGHSMSICFNEPGGDSACSRKPLAWDKRPSMPRENKRRCKRGGRSLTCGSRIDSSTIYLSGLSLGVTFGLLYFKVRERLGWLKV